MQKLNVTYHIIDILINYQPLSTRLNLHNFNEHQYLRSLNHRQLNTLVFFSNFNSKCNRPPYLDKWLMELAAGVCVDRAPAALAVVLQTRDIGAEKWREFAAASRATALVA